jgi:hypothetical protein
MNFVLAARSDRVKLESGIMYLWAINLFQFSCNNHDYSSLAKVRRDERRNSVNYYKLETCTSEKVVYLTAAELDVVNQEYHDDPENQDGQVAPRREVGYLQDRQSPENSY